jgi:Family of unknown function (DUF5677)
MSVHLKEGDFLPEWPAFTPAQFDRASTTGDARPLLFEWYKWTGLVANRVASLDPASPAYRTLPAVEVAVLRGLLNRCSRLMVAVLHLASRQKHAEAVRLLSRGISESTVLIQWLCRSGSGGPFRQYLAKGLDAELRLKSQIEENIRRRGGAVQVVEKRMLAAIAEMCSLAGLTEDEVRQTKRLPDLASMLRALDHEELSYIVMQRQGSHAVHGTWPDLLFHYLEVDDGKFELTDNTVEPENGDFLGAPILVLEAVDAFTRFALGNADLATELQHITRDAITEIVRVHRLTAGNDYSVV